MVGLPPAAPAFTIKGESRILKSGGAGGVTSAARLAAPLLPESPSPGHADYTVAAAVWDF